MQLRFPISDESSDITSQLSTVKSDSRLKVVVLLEQRYTNRFDLATESLQ
jgi:hypothetical protein